mmetsp:Transcript_20161/g.35938  ORF Transcript_20161/g.35938 Transcript_20161/m.35938 type:complete len:486 (+) Transcript_20161:3-1460(+)
MTLLSVNGRRAINDSETNNTMMQRIHKDPTEELVLLFYKKGRVPHIKKHTRNRSEDSLKSIGVGDVGVGVTQRRGSAASTIQFRPNPYLSYIKSVAKQTLNTDGHRNSFTMLPGMLQHQQPLQHKRFDSNQSSRNSQSRSKNNSFDTKSVYVDNLSEAAPTEYVDSAEMSIHEMEEVSGLSRSPSGWRLNKTDIAVGKDESFVVVYPSGVVMSKDVSENTQALCIVPQGTKLECEAKVGRRICVTYKGLKGWVSQYRPDALPLLIATIYTMSDIKKQSSNSDQESSQSTPKKPGRGTNEASAGLTGTSASISRTPQKDRRNSKIAKFGNWLRKKITNDNKYSVGDRVRMKRKTRKLQCGQIGTIAHDNRDSNGHWFVDFISLKDEVERWSLPPGILEPVTERVDQTLIVQFQPDKKIGLGFNEYTRITHVVKGSQAASKGVEIGNMILRINGQKPKKNNVLSAFKPALSERANGLPIVVEFLLEC